MRILITGGAGFIGSHLADSLLNHGHDVVVVDNLITGKIENLNSCFTHPRFAFVNANTEDLPDVDADAVFHLASPASPVGYLNHPIETLLANSAGTHRVLEWARIRRARFLLTSTSEIYGDPLEHPQTESYFGNVDPIGPRSCYDESKRFSEALAFAYARQYGSDIRIVRIFNCYGPRNALDDGRMVPTFIEQALRNGDITVFGDGKQTRSLCYVSDVVSGLICVMFSPKAACGVFNLGNPQEHTISQFAAYVRDYCGSHSHVSFMPGRDAEIAQRKPDISKVVRETGWVPQVGLEEGLKATIEWARGVIGSPQTSAK